MSVPSDLALRADVLTLDDLAMIVKSEHQQVATAVTAALEHALICGQALLLAKKAVRPGQWDAWLADVGIERVAAWRYRLLAANVSAFPVTDRPLSLKAALGHLKVHGATLGQHGLPADVDAAISALWKEGWSRAAIARELGVTVMAVKYRVDPGYAKSRNASVQARKRRLAAANAALKQEQRNRAVKQAGGKPASAYSLLRRCVVELDGAIREAGDEETKRTLAAALRLAYRAEDEIVRALRLPG